MKNTNLVISICAIILVSCNSSGGKKISSSTLGFTPFEPSVTPSQTPKPTRTPIPSMTATATPITPTPLPTMSESELATQIHNLNVLDVFPFSGTLVRIYYIEQTSYSFDMETEEVVYGDYWRGTATESLASIAEADDIWKFRTFMDYSVIETNIGYEPFEDGYAEYDLTDDTVIPQRVGDAIRVFKYDQISWPLNVGQSWGTPHGTPFGGDESGIWHVLERIDITTPAGEFEGCYGIQMRMSSSLSYITFCAGIGIVESIFSFPSSGFFESWTLIDIFDR